VTEPLPNRLVTDVGQALGVTPHVAERVAGTLLGAIAFSSPPDLAAQLKKAIPDHDRLIDRSAPPLGGRTGEMRAMVLDLKTDAGAAGLKAQLTVLGLSSGDTVRALDIFTRFLQDSIGIQTVEQMLDALPGLRGLAR
jgi:hypothetical protein